MMSTPTYPQFQLLKYLQFTMQQGNDNLSQFEKIPTIIFKNALEASVKVASTIADLIRKRQTANLPCVLGLATGNSPIYVYKELVRLHREEGLSFRNVITFNLDEYYPIEKESLHSYWHFMHSQLFDHVDIEKGNINIPDGTIDRNEIEHYCEQYESRIEQCGGIDLQLLGIGGTGHIGFNEPGSSIKSKTRIITLDRKTRSDASSSFFGIENVPKYAITMGVGTILKAKEIVIMAFTEGKANIAQRVIEGDVSAQYPATYLQQHGKTTFVLEQASATKLARNLTPWLIQGLKGEVSIEYNIRLTKKAVIWLSHRTNKPILRLTNQDFEENNLIDLVTQVGKGNSGLVDLVVFNSLKSIITGWPGGGRPDMDPESYTSHRKSTTPQRVVIFSPHPDDDVICMGGTMAKLVNQGHEVHVAYQVTGSLAVFDQDALRFADFLQEAAQLFNLDPRKSIELFNQVQHQIESKKPGDVDQQQLSALKTLIRRTEARFAAMYTGVNRDKIHHLDLPFYETGKAIKKPLGPEDVKIVKEFLQGIKPTSIYAAGDLTDPHGTHRVCLEAILGALEELKYEEWLKACTVYLYRGAWQEWELEKVCMAVPLSPEELYEKRQAIFKHQSQKDRPMFPGSDAREFWQRSEARNKETAQLFTQLGFVNYEALECFVTLQSLREDGEL